MNATYLYCVLHALTKPSAADVPPGLPHATTPRLIDVSKSLWLVSAEVPLDIYGPEPLERQLADLEWVGRTAVAHEAVVEFFARRTDSTVVPMKLYTMFSSQARAVADIASRRRAIESTVKRIQGAEEWGVRVMRSAPADRPADGMHRSATSGAAFLAAKKQARDQAQQARLAAGTAALGAFDRLAALARDARRREDEKIAGAVPPLLDAAFLVSIKDVGTFKKAAAVEAEACANAGATLTLTGPWPAYNFVQADGGR